MKTHCTPAFQHTLDACHLTYGEWRQVARRAHQRHPTRWVRQLTRKVQQVHSGKGMWLRGRYVQRKG
ncbi:MAG TPA: hypothetical protein VI542_33130 [Candidatus Tectomicrobia bacterium]